MSPESTHHHHHHGVISVEDGIEYTTNWRNYLGSSNQAYNVESFWIEIDTIKSLLADNPHADGIRFYTGLSNASDPTSNKVVVVSTKHGVDVIYREDGGSNLRDFATHCPPTCPTGSPLNG